MRSQEGSLAVAFGLILAGIIVWVISNRKENQGLSSLVDKLISIGGMVLAVGALYLVLYIKLYRGMEALGVLALSAVSLLFFAKNVMYGSVVFREARYVRAILVVALLAVIAWRLFPELAGMLPQADRWDR